MKTRILVADDDPHFAKVLDEYLTGRGYAVVVVEDGLRLVEKAGEEPPDLIIADIQMPGAYGSTVHEILKKDTRTASIPILFVSGHPYEQVKRILPDDPRTRFLQKPIKFAELDLMIKELSVAGGSRP